MSSAVFKTGGKQYRVSVGDTLHVERLNGDPGDAVEFPEVLLIGGETPKVGKPTVAGARVKAEIVLQGRGPRIVVFKFRRRKRYKRKNGHRQDFTAIRVTDITG
jgi:large subunit ribosomal protein L21